VRLGGGSFRPLPERGWKALLPARLEGRIGVPLDLSAVEDRFGARFRREKIRLFAPDPGSAECARIVEAVRGEETVVLGLLGRGGYPEGQVRLLRELARRAPRLIPVALLDPEPLVSFRWRDRFLTFDFRRETLAALFDVLLGRTRATGRFSRAGR
jgi:hypothetical protein